VPLAVRIHEGLVWSNRDKRTLLDKMLGLLDILAIKVPFYFWGDDRDLAMAYLLLSDGAVGIRPPTPSPSLLAAWHKQIGERRR
jgi:hypothetical protein